MNGITLGNPDKQKYLEYVDSLSPEDFEGKGWSTYANALKAIKQLRNDTIQNETQNDFDIIGTN